MPQGNFISVFKSIKVSSVIKLEKADDLIEFGHSVPVQLSNYFSKEE